MANYPIDPVVGVVISLDTTPIPQAGFDSVMFLGEHKAFNETWRVYNRSSDMLNDGFEATDPSYIAIRTLESGGAKPKTMIVGRRGFDDITYTPTVENLTVYSLEIAAPQDVFEEFTFTSSGAATAAEIVDGLVADFTANASAALAAVVTLTNVADELELAAIGGSAYAVKNVSPELNPSTATTAGYESVDDAIAGMRAEDASWAYFGIESRLSADVEAARAIAEANTEIFAHATNDPNGKIADSTSTLDEGYAERGLYTVGLWSADSDAYPEMAMLNKLSTVQVPGQTTLENQTLNGIAVDSESTLTGSEALIVRGKNASTYESVAKQGFVFGGKSYSGQFIDNVDLGRWTKARIQENVFQLTKSKADARTKVPMSNVGIELVGERILEVVTQGISAGVYNQEFNDGLGYDLILPDYRDIPTNDRANRHLSGVTLTVQATGAIDTIEISGIITV